MSRWTDEQDTLLRKLVARNIITYTNLEPNYLFEVTQEHFPSFVGTGPSARATAIQRLRKKFRQLAEEFAINGGRLLAGESIVSFVHALQHTSHVSCFSDEDINEGGEDGDEEGWEQVDVDEADEEMAKKEAHTTGKTATTPTKKTQAVASIEKDMKTMSMANGPKFVSFNFNHRFMLTAPVTGYLEDGSRQVYYDYLVNTQVGESFSVTVSEDGLSLKLQAKIPRAFVDLGARARAEFDVSYANSRVITSGFRSTIDDIVKAVGPDFNNIWSPGQIDPLPFACRGNPAMQILWHEGDDALRIKLHHDHRIDVNAKHQMMPVLRVTLLSKEVQRKSTVRVEDAVLRRRSSYESGDCTPPPPPSVPFSPPGRPHSNGFGGGGFPGATGGYSSSSGNEPAATENPIRFNTKKNGNNNSPRKRKSNQNNNDGQQAGDDDNDDNDGDDAKMGENLGVNLVEDFFATAAEELQRAADWKTPEY